MTFIADLIPQKTNIDFIGKRWIGFAISFVIAAATVFLVTTRGLNYGIDFTGGILMEIRDTKPIDLAPLREAISGDAFGEVSLQNFGDATDVIIRIQSKPDVDQAQTVVQVREIVTKTVGDTVEFRSVEYVGPQVSSELFTSGAMALGLALLAMLVYLWFRFEWQFGLGGVVALFHDAIATIGFFAITGLEFNLTSVAAILTIIGYSINDSVVIYDRIRENMRKFKKKELAEIINLSVNETLSRTMLTGSTVLLSVTALLMFGGDALVGFAWAMLFGVVIGTYSSVYISAPVLLYTGARDITQLNTSTPEQKARA